MKRRSFLTNLGATGVGLSLFGKAAHADIKGDAPYAMFNMALNPVPISAGATGNVVVVGGGMAGTTIAKYLRLWGGSGLSVTLVEPNANYNSNIFSNMVLTGDKTLAQLTFNYNNLVSNYGVTLLNSSVTNINVGGKTVDLANGSTLSYDRLVLALGIDFDTLPFIDSSNANVSKIVHAWQAGPQTTNLQKQIQAMTKSDTFILVIPPAPYRCPPGPYERACVVADYLKRVKGGGKVVVLDANAAITAQPTNFGNAFNVTYKGIITYVPGATLTSIDAANMTVNTSKGSYKGKVINAIPTHKAPKLIFDAGLNTSTDGRWAKVNELTYESTLGNGIHIIGDSCNTKKQPKAGHIANAEAKICADAIIKSLTGGTINPSPVTNSSCFTPITQTTASWLAAVYKYDAIQGAMWPFGGGAVESAGANSHNFEDMNSWFTNLMADTGFTPTAG